MRPQTPTTNTHQETLVSLHKVLRGNVSFGNALDYASDGSIATYVQDNGEGILIRVAPNANPLGLSNFWSGSNTDTIVKHNLNRVPIGYIITKKNKTCDVYDGTVVATKQEITLRCTDGSADVVIYVF